VAALRSDYRQAPPAVGLSEADRQMLDFAVRLARDPRAATPDDIEALRAAGFDDTAIHDIVQITGFFSYYNRLADGLGIDPEPGGSAG
jgi:uncharacterized peroxidase-related enzyme